MNYTTVSEPSTLKVHVDKDNTVWFIAGDGAPRCSYKNADKFFSEKSIKLYQAVRLIGSKDNADLLIGLFYLHLKGEINGLQVCSPLLVAGDKQSTPEQLLLTMRCWEGKPSSIGGWHNFDDKDYYHYLLTVKTRRKDPDWLDIRETLKSHPAWVGLSFIKHLDLDKTAKLLGLIVDPRWYIDPDKPDKSSKLESYLGLTPSTQRNVTNGQDSGRTHTRCKLVLEAWQKSEPQYDDPADFLWRVWKHHNGGWFADLRTSQTFISFLRLVWLNQLYKGRGLFVPEYFFHNREDESEAYKDYLATKKI